MKESPEVQVTQPNEDPMNAASAGIQPIERREPPPAVVQPATLGRALRVLLVERRVPYRLQTLWERAMHALGLTHKTVTIDGLRYRVRRLAWDEGFLRNAVESGNYTRQEFALRATDTVIDIGANIGAFSVYAASQVKRGRVLAFEPASDNFALLAQNARLNGLANLTTVRAAVAGRSGSITLYRAQGSGAHSTTAGRLAATTGTEEVEALSLEEVFRRYDVDRCHLLKLNCEGAEFEILYSAPAEVLARIDRIAMEYHATEDKRRKANELIAHLRRHGFQVVEYLDYVDLDCGFLSVRR
jgi:FkbM family methyltransferase